MNIMKKQSPLQPVMAEWLLGKSVVEVETIEREVIQRRAALIDSPFATDAELDNLDFQLFQIDEALVILGI